MSVWSHDLRGQKLPQIWNHITTFIGLMTIMGCLHSTYVTLGTFKNFKVRKSAKNAMYLSLIMPRPIGRRHKR